ncbi:hypothetical protein PV326_002184 [Microctonus aethiopoides]|nr:hypothetical protein PV326_002184 [Microctonus aethiopoides]
MCDINYDIKKICIPVKIQTEYQTFLYVKAHSQGYGRDKPATESGVIRKTTTKYIPKLELYLPYAPLPGGGGILPAVSSSVGGGGCRPVLLGGVDLSMSAAVQSASNIVPPSHNSLHPPVGLVGGGGGGGGGSGSGPPLPSLNNGPTLMSRGPPPVTIQPLGSSLAPVLHHDDPDITDAPPNPDVLLALLARNKNLEGK